MDYAKDVQGFSACFHQPHVFCPYKMFLEKTKNLLDFCLDFAEATMVGCDKLCSVEGRKSFESRATLHVQCLVLNLFGAL